MSVNIGLRFSEKAFGPSMESFMPRRLYSMAPAKRRISNGGHRVIVGDEIERLFVFFLEGDELPKRPEIIPQVERIARGLGTREHTHLQPSAPI